MSLVSVSASRCVMAENLVSHQLRLRTGITKCSGQQCQKQPCTSTATRDPRSRTSTRRLRGSPCGLASTRNRMPRACSARRRAISGAVSLRRFATKTARTAADDGCGATGTRIAVYGCGSGASVTSDRHPLLAPAIKPSGAGAAVDELRPRGAFGAGDVPLSTVELDGRCASTGRSVPVAAAQHLAATSRRQECH